MLKGSCSTVEPPHSFAVVLLLTVFFYARYLFGYWAGIIALLLCASEPTLIAHADLVTTDVAVSAGLLLAVFLLDRYLRTRTLPSLVLAGLALGLALSAKHSGVIVIPIAIALTVVDECMRGDKLDARRQGWTRAVGGLALILLIGVGVLWATYGFRYWPRPHAAPMTVSLADFLTRVRSEGTTGIMSDYLIPFAARWHLLPLAYLYGLIDILNVSPPGLPPWILGRLLPHGVWYYFPVTFVIKPGKDFLIQFPCMHSATVLPLLSRSLGVPPRLSRV